MYLEEALPAISGELKANEKGNIYDAMHTLTTFMGKNIKAHNYKVVKKCFDIAGKLYDKGNKVVKDAVQNIFVYSFTQIFHTYAAEKKEVLALLPMTLYSLYMAQIHHNGC